MYRMDDDPDAVPDDIDRLLDTNSAGPDEINPPDVDPMGLLDRGHAPVDLGIGSTYIETMYDTVGSHRAYHELGVLAMLGTAIQHRWLYRPYAQYGKQRANVYGCILGRSSFDHKTTAGSKVTQHMPWEFMPNASALPGYFTEEGLYKELNERPMGLIWRDEVAMLFASRDRKYTQFVVPFLTAAYDGWMPGKRLSQTSYASKEIALSILGATTYTEFARTTLESDWDSGWLVRWLFAMPDPTYDPARRLRKFTEADETALREVRNKLSDLNTRNAAPMHIDEDADTYLEDWRRMMIYAAVDCTERHERVDAIIERYATYAVKFAMILCAGRGDGERISLEHAEGGARLAENYMTTVYRLYQYQREHRMTGALLNKALAFLNRHAEGMTRRDLGRVMSLNATTRDEVIALLMEAGVAEERTAGKTTRLFATQKRLPAMRVTLSA